jgi:phage tail-like protein
MTANQTPTPLDDSHQPYTSAVFALELDQGTTPSVLKSIEGGDLKAEVMTFQMGSNTDLWRQSGKPKYGDIKLTTGMSCSEGFYKWIEAFFDGKAERRSGAICAGDFLFKERARREFFEAMICEFSFPKLDAADKNACFITVTLASERIRTEPGTNKDLPPADLQNEKLWAACNFDFEIKGFEDACAHVTKIDQFAIKQKVIEYQAGNQRDALKLPGRIEFPNLAFYLPENEAKDFFRHVKSRVIDGAPAPDTRLTGAITVLDNAGNTLCTVDLAGCDINAVTPDKQDGGSDEVKQVKVDLIVERMKFKWVPPAK